MKKNDKKPAPKKLNLNLTQLRTLSKELSQVAGGLDGKCPTDD